MTKRDEEPSDEPATKRRKQEKEDATIETIFRNTSLPEEIKFPAIPASECKITCYNVSGLNASLKKGFKRYINAENADIICLQETKFNNDPAVPLLDKNTYPHQSVYFTWN